MEKKFVLKFVKIFSITQGGLFATEISFVLNIKLGGQFRLFNE